MPLKTPAFWYDAQSPAARLKAAALGPATLLYSLGHIIHQNSVHPVDVGIPVLCIGNLVAGGSGKTPAAITIMEMIREDKRFSNPCFLSRGYGGTMRGPLLVDPMNHTALEVGDEPLLLTATAPTIICANRIEGAIFAKRCGHDIIIMDDGLQNMSLRKNLSIIVIDGASGFGNEKMIPSGPLRTPIARGLGKADAVLLIGQDRHRVLRHIPEALPVLRAEVVATAELDPHPAYIAFCGIAQPEKFRATLDKTGVNIMEFYDFPDHHPYSANDLATLQNRATDLNVRLVTTAKDAARLPSSFIQTAQVAILPVRMEWAERSDCILMGLVRSRITPGAALS